MKFSQFILSATFKLRILFASLLSRSKCCSKFKSFCQLAQMSNLIDLCACMLQGTVGLQSYSSSCLHWRPWLICAIFLLIHRGENSVYRESCSVGAEPEHHRFTLASGDVQGLSKLRSMANVGRNCIPVAEHCISSSVLKQPIEISVLDSSLGNRLGTYVALPSWIHPVCMFRYTRMCTWKKLWKVSLQVYFASLIDPTYMKSAF